MAKKTAAKKPVASAKKTVAAAKKPAVAKKVAAKPVEKAKKEAPPKKAATPAPKMAAKVSVEQKKEVKKEILVEPKAKKPAKVEEVIAEVIATPEPKPIKVPKLKKSEQAKINADKAALNEEERRWNEFHEKHKSDKAQSYDMKATFEAAKPLQHKVLGWGWILSNDNDRLEVLFRDGKRILISNYNR